MAVEAGDTARAEYFQKKMDEAMGIDDDADMPPLNATPM